MKYGCWYNLVRYFEACLNQNNVKFLLDLVIHFPYLTIIFVSYVLKKEISGASSAIMRDN